MQSIAATYVYMIMKCFPGRALLVADMANVVLRVDVGVVPTQSFFRGNVRLTNVALYGVRLFVGISVLAHFFRRVEALTAYVAQNVLSCTVKRSF